MDPDLLVADYTNADWLNAVRNDAGLDYQDRIPEATQANVQEVIQTLWKYKPYMNKFIDGLVNRIGLVIYQEWSWANPLAPLKRGMLQMGETIEEIMVGLVDAEEYDPDRDALEKELFGAVKPEVDVSYHVVNRRSKYKITIREPELVNAFITPGGLSKLVTQLLGAAQKSDQIDEFALMANLFSEIDKAATGPDGTPGLFNVRIADIGSVDSTDAENRYALRRMREFGHELQFPSRAYNPARMPQAVRPDDLILFTTPQADAAMDVEALAGAFNIDKAQVGYRKFVLPERFYGIPGFQMALTTKEFFVVADQRIETTSMPNPASLLTNYWLHHWQVISASRYAPIIMFNSLRESTQLSRPTYEVTGITDFTITDIDGNVVTGEVARGEVYNVAVEAETVPAGGPVAVRLSVSGNESIFTRITNTGALRVGIDETGDLTLKAIAVHDDVEQISEEVSLTVVGDGYRKWPNPGAIEDTDADGVEETTPVAPKFEAPDKIIVPNSERVEYRDGATPVNGTTVTIAGASGTTKTITAVAKAGWELKAGATASWTYTKA